MINLFLVGSTCELIDCGDCPLIRLGVSAHRGTGGRIQGLDPFWQKVHDQRVKGHTVYAVLLSNGREVCCCEHSLQLKQPGLFAPARVQQAAAL